MHNKRDVTDVTRTTVAHNEGTNLVWARDLFASAHVVLRKNWLGSFQGTIFWRQWKEWNPDFVPWRCNKVRSGTVVLVLANCKSFLGWYEVKKVLMLQKGNLVRLKLLEVMYINHIREEVLCKGHLNFRFYFRLSWFEHWWVCVT